MIRWQFHHKRSRFAGKHFCLFQHYTGNDDSRHSNKIRTGSNPPSTPEKSRRNERYNRKFCSARNECCCNYCHSPISFILNSSGSHYTRNSATGSYKQRNKRLTRKSDFTKKSVHNESDSGHISASFKKSKENKEHQHLRNKAQNRTYTTDNSVKHKTTYSFITIDSI